MRSLFGLAPEKPAVHHNTKKQKYKKNKTFFAKPWQTKG